MDRNQIMDKDILRKAVLQKRTAIYSPEINGLIVDRLSVWLGYRQARTVMLVASFDTEIDTRRLIRTALLEGKRVALPVCKAKGRRMAPTVIRDVGRDLEKGCYGIMEPSARCPVIADPETIDLILVPGMAFNEQGYRLGYGGGYYDRFLKDLHHPVTVGLAREAFIRPDIPVEPHDLPVQWVMTEKRLIRT